MNRSLGRYLGMGITLSWIADWGWGIGLYVGSSGLGWLVWPLELWHLAGGHTKHHTVHGHLALSDTST